MSNNLSAPEYVLEGMLSEFDKAPPSRKALEGLLDRVRELRIAREEAGSRADSLQGAVYGLGHDLDMSRELRLQAEADCAAMRDFLSWLTEVHRDPERVRERDPAMWLDLAEEVQQLGAGHHYVPGVTYREAIDTLGCLLDLPEAKKRIEELTRGIGRESQQRIWMIALHLYSKAVPTAAPANEDVPTLAEV